MTKPQPHDWALTLADLLEGGLPERERRGVAVIGDVVYWSDESKGQRWSAIVNSVSDWEPAEDRVRQSARMRLNPEPLTAKKIPVCRACGKRAPWCSCGEMAYE